MISPAAYARVLLRTVRPTSEVKSKVESVIQGSGLGNRTEVDFRYLTEPAVMQTVPGFETAIGGFCTDIPNFAPLGAKALLYGPGSIFNAHTEHEQVKLAELEAACAGYMKIYGQL